MKSLILIAFLLTSLAQVSWGHERLDTIAVPCHTQKRGTACCARHSHNAIIPVPHEHGDNMTQLRREYINSIMDADTLDENGVPYSYENPSPPILAFKQWQMREKGWAMTPIAPPRPMLLGVDYRMVLSVPVVDSIVCDTSWGRLVPSPDRTWWVWTPWCDTIWKETLYRYEEVE